MNSEQQDLTVVHADQAPPEAKVWRWREIASAWYQKLLELIRPGPEVGDAPLGLPLEPSIKSLVDPLKLDRLVFQRDVLTWRDRAHARMHGDLQRLHRTFSAHIDTEMKRTGILEKIFAKPADEVLREAFAQQITGPLQASLARERDALAACMATRGGYSSDTDGVLGGGLAETDCAWLQPLAFKPSKHPEITQVIHTWLLGSDGIAAQLHMQITRIADELTESK